MLFYFSRVPSQFQFFSLDLISSCYLYYFFANILVHTYSSQRPYMKPAKALLSFLSLLFFLLHNLLSNYFLLYFEQIDLQKYRCTLCVHLDLCSQGHIFREQNYLEEEFYLHHHFCNHLHRCNPVNNQVKTLNTLFDHQSIVSTSLMDLFPTRYFHKHLQLLFPLFLRFASFFHIFI